jgi:ribosomal protein S15P/S13E
MTEHIMAHKKDHVSKRYVDTISSKMRVGRVTMVIWQ